jgi:HK97 family phage major capsid protein/HK97 family phage prohead protease
MDSPVPAAGELSWTENRQAVTTGGDSGAPVDRAYSLLEIKAVAPERRTFSGIASTPELDRQGDSVDPAGVTFRNPLPLLFHHDTRQPIGTVVLTATPEGILFEATLPTIDEPGRLKTRVDEAWQSVKAGVITGVSIGHRILEGGYERLKNGTRRLTHTEICEVSLVTIPANANASIRLIKSLAAPQRLERVMAKQTTAEHIQALENKRAALAARLGDIMATAAADEATLDDEHATEYDTLELQVKSIDADLVRWRDLEKIQVKTATPVPTVALARSPSLPVISVRPNVPIGTAFVRAACAKLVCNGNLHEAAEYAKRWDDSTPEVSLYLKAAIAPGSSTDAAWAGPLVNQNIANDFIELLRPATILGKIPGLRQVPFNTKVPSQTAGGTYGWVGEAKPKPVTKLAFASTSLGITKVAGIIVLTEELVRLSSPSAEALCRADMVAGIAQFLDAQFIDPAVAAVAGVNPASITNGAPTAAATTNPMADIMGLINHFATNNIAVDGVTFIMSAANALALSFRSNLDGSPQYPGITINGGTYKGLTFITSQAAGGNVIALQPQLILYADDGGVTIDASREASLQMDSAPMSPSDATTVYVSLWQTNTVGLRAERFINWNKASANAVKYLTATAWPAPTGGVPEANGGNGRAAATK